MKYYFEFFWVWMNVPPGSSSPSWLRPVLDYPMTLERERIRWKGIAVKVRQESHLIKCSLENIKGNEKNLFLFHSPSLPALMGPRVTFPGVPPRGNLSGSQEVSKGESRPGRPTAAEEGRTFILAISQNFVLGRRRKKNLFFCGGRAGSMRITFSSAYKEMRFDWNWDSFICYSGLTLLGVPNCHQWELKNWMKIFCPHDRRGWESE